MPFVGLDRSTALIKREILPETVGDLCCLAYAPMVEKWLANPRWTTAHRIRKDVWDGTWNEVHLLSRIETIPPHLKVEIYVAIQLAWEVFYDFYVSEYERSKFDLNGGVLSKEH